MRWAAIAFLLGHVACLDAPVTECADGAICPNGLACAPAGGCADPLAVAACTGVTDGGACQMVTGALGRCREAVCSFSKCGDGVRDLDETCDDGNADDGDGCARDCGSTEMCGNGIRDIFEDCDCGEGQGELPLGCSVPNGQGECRVDCTLPVCGDGEQDANEACDAGSANSEQPDAACRLNCTLRVCGDGVVDVLAGEVCDEGLANAIGGACLPSCIQARCGDGLEQLGVELCDDGNFDDFDYCGNDCVPSTCGNGVLDAGETCDDGNVIDVDGCPRTCRPATCGDGFVHAGIETCDDGRRGVNSTCPRSCLVGCGDGQVENEERCDDGNDDHFDGCGNDCRWSVCDRDQGQTTTRQGATSCYDYHADARTYADARGACMSQDGDLASLETTAERAVVAPLLTANSWIGLDATSGPFQWSDGTPFGASYWAPGQPSAEFEQQCVIVLPMAAQRWDNVRCDLMAGYVCERPLVPGCGDGSLGVDEICDDGNTDSTDACPATCRPAFCGDGFVQAGFEGCDDGNASDDDLCRRDCTPPVCGNGIREGLERCDDGNLDTDDACITCIEARCGDGLVWTGVETCDDGNGVDDDGCGNDCQLPVCGDGDLEGDEYCDDGNQAFGDGCGSTCLEPMPCGENWPAIYPPLLQAVRETDPSSHPCAMAYATAVSFPQATPLCRLAAGVDIASEGPAPDGLADLFAYLAAEHGEFWLSLNDQTTEGGFRFANGLPPSMLRWAPGEPNGGTGENCVTISADGLWRDRPCSSFYRPLCMGAPF